jgi:hypothetical protein
MDNFNLKQYLAEGKLHENVIPNNKYVTQNEDGDWEVSKQAVKKFMDTIDHPDVNPDLFIGDDEGWGEMVPYMDEVETWTNQEMEDTFKRELSYYFFSRPDEIDMPLNEDEDHSLDMVLNEMVNEDLSPADIKFIKDNEVEIRNVLKISDDFEIDEMEDHVAFYDIKDEEGEVDIISKDEYDRLQNELNQLEVMKSLDTIEVNGKPLYVYDLRN